MLLLEEKQNSSFIGDCVSSYLFPSTYNLHSSDLKKSIYIHKKTLLRLRVLFLAYTIISFVAAIATSIYYRELLAAPYWSFIFQILYFAIVVRNSYGRRVLPFSEKTSLKMTTMLYEVVFSLQLYNFMYYWIFTVQERQNWKNGAIYQCNQFNLYVVVFFITWMEQLFSVIKMCFRHMWIVIIATGVNFGVAAFIALNTGGALYNGTLDLITSTVLRICVDCDFDPFTYYAFCSGISA